MEDMKRLTTKHNDVKLSIIERLVPVSNPRLETALFLQSKPQQNLTLWLITTDSHAVVIFRTVLLHSPQLTETKHDVKNKQTKPCDIQLIVSYNI